MSMAAHPIELAVALGLLAPHSLEHEEPVQAEPSAEERASVALAFREAAARLDEEQVEA